MKEVNHRVQNSLQLVSAFLSLEAKAAGDQRVTEHLTEAQARLSAVALVHRRLYRDEQVETVDLSRYLDELLGDLKTSLGAQWAAQMSTDLAPVLMPTDRAVNVGLILTELVINASKYAYAGQPGPISVMLEQYRNIQGFYHGDYYPLMPYSQDKDAWIAWQFNCPEIDAGMIQVFRRERSIDKCACLNLNGLDPDARYMVKKIDASDGEEIPGSELMEKGLDVHIEDCPGAVIATYRKIR